MFGFTRKKLEMPSTEDCLAGRPNPITTAKQHAVNHNALKGPFPAGYEIAYFAMGCYWGAERIFWNLPGVWVTAVGNIAGTTPNPTYQEVCTGQTGHAEAVMVVYDPATISYEKLLQVFWESHDPTQGMRQGNDTGTQYRSAIHCLTESGYLAALASGERYVVRLQAAGYGPVTTEIVFPAPPYYYAEDAHQQYLAKNPNGYCGIGGTGVSCPIGLDAAKG